MHTFMQALRLLAYNYKGAMLGPVLLLVGMAAAKADAVEVLQGAWVGEGSDCAKVFEKVQGKFRFKDRTYAQDNGFIIVDRKAKGPVGGSCVISDIDEEDDRFSARLSCSDAVVSREFSWSFRIIDATHFERFDERGAYKYKKCAL